MYFVRRCLLGNLRTNRTITGCGHQLVHFGMQGLGIHIDKALTAEAGNLCLDPGNEFRQAAVTELLQVTAEPVTPALYQPPGFGAAAAVQNETYDKAAEYAERAFEWQPDRETSNALFKVFEDWNAILKTKK